MHAIEMLDQVEAHHGLVHRHLDKAALSCAFTLEQGRHHRMRCHQATGLVSGNGRQVAGLASLALHQIGQPAHALDHIVIGGQAGIGAILAKAMQAHVDQARVLAAQPHRVQPQLGQFLRPHAVHEDIAGLEQRMQRLLGLGRLQVQHHAFLAAVGAHEQRRHAGLGGRPGVARGVAAGRLDLDHLGAVIGQHLAGQRPENHAG